MYVKKQRTTIVKINLKRRNKTGGLTWFFMQSCFSCVQLYGTLWTVACQSPLSIGFPRQEHWSELTFPSPGDLPDPGTELLSPASPALAGGFLTTEPPGKPLS